CLTCDREIKGQGLGHSSGPEAKARGSFLPKLEPLAGGHAGAPVGPGINVAEARRLVEEKLTGHLSPKSTSLAHRSLQEQGSCSSVRPLCGGRVPGSVTSQQSAPEQARLGDALPYPNLEDGFVLAVPLPYSRKSSPLRGTDGDTQGQDEPASNRARATSARTALPMTNSALVPKAAPGIGRTPVFL
ncbi:hypothetical protein QJQ45_017631, partial [Haematococcus lacustris]